MFKSKEQTNQSIIIYKWYYYIKEKYVKLSFYLCVEHVKSKSII